MKRSILAVCAVLLAVVAVAGCGGGTRKTSTSSSSSSSATSSTTTSTTTASAQCVAGASFMGCSVTPTPTKPGLTRPSGKIFPDVSSYQGHPDWQAARSHIAGAVAKLGEGATIFDSDAGYNVAAFKRLHIPYAVYWFVRPVGCAAEGNAIVTAARNVGGVDRIVLDEEVGGIAGYAACLESYVERASGHQADVYRSSGNDYDDSAPSDPCWVAAYGPSSPPACPGRTRKAWQFTDGQYGFPTIIPGVGTDDVSIDEGLLSAAAKPVNPRHWSWLPNARRAVGRRDHAREQNTVRTWDQAKCVNPVRRKICRTSRTHLRELAGRVSFIAHHTGKHLRRRAKRPRWTALHYRAGRHVTTLGGAYHQLTRRLTAKRPVARW